ncbi:DUF928 domain-containing protein [Plectonema cf. radiosum LEGE 06105]|uniref:DUF928 domain-containing protein n=1 Tax=Plectonema cf. radiosum LEGE 06105 TaxID=945769 RepID=A0A8J7F7T2_9CYAN|nr:DUF928 domain-containing protein [Plectonema radiosum]MBE9215750.1 DUF928 domain-containing protein [Plectonema cf. radiosum LEGE 06105]
MMHLMSRIPVKFTNCRLLSGLLLSSLILLPTVALANYSPQRRNPPKENTRVGGSRGCPGEGNIPLTVVLAPHTFVGKTASVRPTLAWFASKPEKTEIHVYEFGSNNKMHRTIAIAKIHKSQTRAGINKFKLPPDKALTPGKQYLWQVSIQCTDGSDLIQKAEFEVVQKTRTLEAQLSNVTDSTQRANIYARNELWYEALDEALKIYPQDKLGKIDSQLIEDLILVYKDELKNEVREAKKQDIQKQISNLQAILNDNISIKKIIN